MSFINILFCLLSCAGVVELQERLRILERAEIGTQQRGTARHSACARQAPQ